MVSLEWAMRASVPLFLGIFMSAAGLVILGLLLYRAAVAANPPGPDEWLAYPAAIIFVLIGVLVAMPVRLARARVVVGALLMTAFAITFDWIAFGPGETPSLGALVGGLLKPGADKTEKADPRSKIG